ncbi:MAG: OsmC family peroxiredoxin [Candidatus Promineifilaceae bacterium]
MTIRSAEATWEGNLREGSGAMRFGSGAFEGAYTYASRFEDAAGTNPEELVGAAHAGCFSMALASDLSKAGYTPVRIDTSASVHFGRDDIGALITLIELETTAHVPDVDEQTFLRIAEGTRKNCPVSRALAATNIELVAHLVKDGDDAQ